MSDHSVRRIWEATLGQLQLQVTRPSFDTWLKGTVGLSYQDNQLVVGVPTTFAAEWLEQRMAHLIEKMVGSIVKGPVTVSFELLAHSNGEPLWTAFESDGKPAYSPERITSPGTASFKPCVNGKYTFDNFVVGEANRLAHATAQEVALHPGEAYNPLFIYSRPGLGKTHLLHAIAAQVTHRHLACLYVTTEQFTHDFISAIRSRKTEEFRHKYRCPDVLLIDDIHFIGGKEQTQDGFFHLFNDLHNSNRQIVITSDRQPSTLQRIEDRLRSRFQWGLIADILPPDLQTRIAILRMKAEQNKVDVAGDAMEYIASKVVGNIRELEGSLNRVIASARLTQSPISPQVCATVLSNVSQDHRRRTLQPEELLSGVAAHFGLSPTAIHGKSRDRLTTHARQIAMYLLRSATNLSLQEIGTTLGNRDHSTVVHAIRRVSQELETNTPLREELRTLQATAQTGIR